jgi:hyperosmotically inducible periplasmic protein
LGGLRKTLNREEKITSMNHNDRLVLRCVFAIVFAAVALPTRAQQRQVSQQAVERIQKEVRHELIMLPYVTMFDNLGYKVDGYNVTLVGQVTKPSLKSDAESVVKRIEGVEKVDNQIEVLPISPMDDRLRQSLYRAIYAYPPLQRYGMPVVKPIRIIVKNGHVYAGRSGGQRRRQESRGIARQYRPGSVLGEKRFGGREVIGTVLV